MRMLCNTAGAGLLTLMTGMSLHPAEVHAGPITTAPFAKPASNVIAVADFGRHERRRTTRRVDRHRWQDDDFIYSRSRCDPDYYEDDGDDYEYVTVYRSVRTVIVEPPYGDIYVHRRRGRVFAPFVEVQWRD